MAFIQVFLSQLSIVYSLTVTTFFDTHQSHSIHIHTKMENGFSDATTFPA